MDVYVCITYYHILISMMKSIKSTPKNDLIICAEPFDTVLLNDCELLDRINASRIFNNVYISDYSRYEYGEKGLTIDKLQKRWRRRKAIIGEQSIDFSRYKNIFIFNDTVACAQYLTKKRIPYVCLEDGTDCLKVFDPNKNVTIKHKILKLFGLETPLLYTSKLIKYIEVNDKCNITIKDKAVQEMPKQKLVESLTGYEKTQICKAFVDIEKFKVKENSVLILTQPLNEDGFVVDEQEKIRIYKKIIDAEQGKAVVIKKHPREKTNYREYFSNVEVIDQVFPMEVLSLGFNNTFEKVITIGSTAMGMLTCVKPENQIVLGWEWLKTQSNIIE